MTRYLAFLNVLAEGKFHIGVWVGTSLGQLQHSDRKSQILILSIHIMKSFPGGLSAVYLAGTFNASSY